MCVAMVTVVCTIVAYRMLNQQVGCSSSYEKDWRATSWGVGGAGGYFNIKTVFSRYKDFHYTDAHETMIREVKEQTRPYETLLLC